MKQSNNQQPLSNYGTYGCFLEEERLHTVHYISEKALNVGKSRQFYILKDRTYCDLREKNNKKKTEESEVLFLGKAKAREMRSWFAPLSLSHISPKLYYYYSVLEAKLQGRPCPKSTHATLTCTPEERKKEKCLNLPPRFHENTYWKKPLSTYINLVLP